MRKHEEISKHLTEKMEYENKTSSYEKVSFDDSLAIRRCPDEDKANVWRTPFMRDSDKIIHCPYFSRYADKTQVFSLYKNDDLTRRFLHVQFVSRIARTIGSALHLNLDLIEAISLGHDIGHPAFAHTGEKYLDELFYKHTGKRFLHNLQSVRVLDRIFPLNLTLQTLTDIAAHNGEIELDRYLPVPVRDFREFDEIMKKCSEDINYANHLMPCTLEGAVVRISDIIAYLGRDRQDAILTNTAQQEDFYGQEIGSFNAEIINNLVVNIIECSYGKPYITLDKKHFDALRKYKLENYAKIYNHAAANARLDQTVKPMMTDIYGQLLDDLKAKNKNSPIYKFHIEPQSKLHYRREIPYEDTEPNQLIADFIASMTDDYFIELHKYMFPDTHYPVVYRGYFDN